MLKIWILNVGQGDSIVISYEANGEKHFGVIDSNRTGTGAPSALRKLQYLGAERLSFVALTHPHADHYSGLSDILRAYTGKISSFYSFPIGLHIEGRLKKLASLYKDFSEQTESLTAKKRVREFLEILIHAKDKIGLKNWEEFSGAYNLAMPLGFGGVNLIAILPPAKVKGPYFEMLEKGDFSVVDGRPKENDLSLAFWIQYRGREIVLGGDGTYENWMDHQKLFDRKPMSLNAEVAKLPHHGSRRDFKESVLKHIYADGAERSALISAAGQKLPDPETIALLEKHHIKPYCTNLAKQCGANIRHLISLPEVAPVLRRLVNSFGEISDNLMQPCQGDLCVTIGDDGALSIETEHNHPCPYRGDYDGLFGT